MRVLIVVVGLMFVGCGGKQQTEDGSTAAEGSQPADETAATDTPKAEEKLGSLPKEEIRGVVRENMRDIQACYDSELELSPGLAGKVVVHFVISKEGTVQKAEIAESTLENRAVERCIQQDVLGWEFNEPENDGIVIVNYPFNFKAP